MSSNLPGVVTQDIVLKNTLFRFKRGLEDNLPAEAPEGEPLLSMGPGQWKLWAGAGEGNPIQLIGGGSVTGGASFIVNQDNHGLDKVFVMYNAETGLWEKAYASYVAETDTSNTAIGFATQIDNNQFTVTMLGEVILEPTEAGAQTLVDVEGNNLVPGEYYYLVQDEENAGKVQKEKPSFGVVQLVLQCISVDEEEGTRIVLFTQEAYNSEEQTYSGQQKIIFSEASLDESGNMTITHNLNSTAISISVYDNTGKQVIPDEIQIVDNSTVNLSFTDFFRPIEGTWTAILIGGATRDSSLSFNSYTTTFSEQTSVTVSHNLGTESVVIAVYDSTGLKIEPYKIQVTDLNTVTLNFDSATSGKVVVSGNGIGTFTGIDFQTADDIPAGQTNKYFNEEILLGLLNDIIERNTIISQWLLINTGSVYTFTHNLGSLDYDVDYYVSDGVGTVVKGFVNQAGTGSAGTALVTQGPASVTFRTGDNAIFSIKSGSTTIAPTTGRLQILIRKRTLT